jgi:hypothetical protein
VEAGLGVLVVGDAESSEDDLADGGCGGVQVDVDGRQVFAGVRVRGGSEKSPLGRTYLG